MQIWCWLVLFCSSEYQNFRRRVVIRTVNKRRRSNCGIERCAHLCPRELIEMEITNRYCSWFRLRGLFIQRWCEPTWYWGWSLYYPYGMRLFVCDHLNRLHCCTQSSLCEFSLVKRLCDFTEFHLDGLSLSCPLILCSVWSKYHLQSWALSPFTFAWNLSSKSRFQCEGMSSKDTKDQSPIAKISSLFQPDKDGDHYANDDKNKGGKLRSLSCKLCTVP